MYGLHLQMAAHCGEKRVCHLQTVDACLLLVDGLLLLQQSVLETKILSVEPVLLVLHMLSVLVQLTTQALHNLTTGTLCCQQDVPHQPDNVSTLLALLWMTTILM